MTRDAIIRELVESRFVENYALHFIGKADRVYLDDIVAELYLMICELPSSLVVNIYNGCGLNCFRRYISGMVVRQLLSDNSRIYRKYTRHVYRQTPTDTVMLCAEKDREGRI